MPTLNHYLILSAILFAIGTAGVFLRRNLITILLSIEIMLNAVNLTFVAFGRALGIGRRADHRVLRHDRGRRRSRGRPGDRHRAVPAPESLNPDAFTSAEMVTARPMLLLIPLLPFLGFLLNASFGRRLSQGRVRRRRRARRWSASFAVSLRRGAGSCVGLPRRSRARSSSTVFTWIASGDFSAGFTLRLDPLSAVMILVITGIGSLIHIYSTAYMHDETRLASSRATSRT